MFGWGWLNGKLSRKLMSAYIIVVFLPIVIIVASGDALYRSQLENNLQQTTNLAFRQLTLNMVNYFELVDDAIDQAFRDRELHEQLKYLKNTGVIDTLEDIEYLFAVNERLELFSEQFGTRVDQFGFFFESGFAMRNITRYEHRLPDPTPEQLQQLREDGKVYRKFFTLEEFGGNWHITASRGMLDLSNGEFLALFRVVDSSGDIIRMLDEWTDTASRLFLMNEKGEVLLSQTHDAAERFPELDAVDWLAVPTGEEGYAVQAEGKPYLLLKEQLTDQLYIGAVISYTQWMQPITQLRNLLMFTALAVLAAATGVYSAIAWDIVKPLSNLTSLIRRAKSGDLKIRFRSRRTDEIGQLGEGFNAMAEEIDHLMDRVLRTQLKAKEAELQVLQNQIKPHFLQNTLESINMLAIIHGNTEVSEMVTLLGKFYRSVQRMSKKQVTIPLREELELTRVYLSIQQIRFAAKFEVVWEMEEDLLDSPILKLVLQPIVENAIVHGIEPKVGNSVLRISCKRETADGGVLVMTVADDGIGIPPSVLAAIQENLRFVSDEKSIGIQNVHERIRLFYGNDSGLSIESRYGEGTVVTIRIPILPIDQENRGSVDGTK